MLRRFLQSTTATRSVCSLNSCLSSFSSVAVPSDPAQVRNVAVIAHVDHGKTTLVDKILHEGVQRNQDTNRVMDSGALEKERGITIMSKTTRVEWKDHFINLVDTPGHADFGGEVERVLSMVDGAVLVVDATEGVMSQTKFVVSKAINMGLHFVVVLNKADRDTARLSGEVESEIFDLLCNLGASEDQLDFPILYASAKEGWAVLDLEDDRGMKMDPLLRTLVGAIQPPCDRTSCTDEPFRFAVNNISHDIFLGPTVTGKVSSGMVSAKSKVHVLTRESASGETTAPPKTPHPQYISHLYVMQGTERMEVESAQAGDIVVLTGVSDVCVSDTICDVTVIDPLDTHPVTPPTMAMSFGANDGPLAGRSGATFLNSNQIKDRLRKEVENNVTINLHPDPTNGEKLEVHGRGELQFGILIEEMRREGYELTISAPRIVTTEDDEGRVVEPIEELTIDIDTHHSGAVIERMQLVRAEMEEYKEMGPERVRLVFQVPSRLLMGIRADLRQATHGNAIVNAMFTRYDPVKGAASDKSKPGRLVSTETGTATGYALFQIQARGQLFVSPGQDVYEGMVVGENSRPGDLDVNPCKAKKLTNVRTVLADDAAVLVPPRRSGVEDLITYMDTDEMLEITPDRISLRKKILDASARARAVRSGKHK
uniref:Tr-type G domain-containing protein n=1 Tax=Octactis speculum TaxID=3111310 RepID=A0A7S2C4J9_9STRA|mmetsp:Transcript_31511/g.42671  ORF Transcript_31511/g.42671 Transcript_31511/m.42671 type:complete len:655 (+) Transcript_31511:55-2019(+)